MNRLNRMNGRLVTAKKAATNNGPVRNEAGKPRRDRMNPDKTANRTRTPFTAATLTPKVWELPVKGRYFAAVHSSLSRWRETAKVFRLAGCYLVTLTRLRGASHFSPLTNHFSLVIS